ncbi:hypothetical protein HTZ84_22340 [Haloterrigena sp. SYSU A558-1]|uniref:Uncharacterized protein n=1 Tax=Haloterrigena gelatinilytica TaxID=2741724 RepID=A0ABX2LFI0_9EURY|nr:hypothetical protein [Haloterrigena gelatinilytica]NUC75007.1 hypothetical protein [Haloterrigena gelatinilytica]
MGETSRREAYEQTKCEIVETGAGAEIPVSTPAGYKASESVDPARLQNAFTRRGYTFIAPYREGGHLSSKVYDSETNEFFHIKVNESLVRIFPKSHDFSFATFDRALDTLERRVGEVNYVPQGTGGDR